MLGTYDYPRATGFELVSVAAFVGVAGALARRVVVEVADRLSWPVALLVIGLVLAAYAVPTSPRESFTSCSTTSGHPTHR